MYFRSTPQSLTCGLTEEELAMWFYSPLVKNSTPIVWRRLYALHPRSPGLSSSGRAGQIRSGYALGAQGKGPRHGRRQKSNSRRAVAIYHQSEPNCSSFRQDWSGPRFLHDGWEAYAENGQGHSEAAPDEPSLRKRD